MTHLSCCEMHLNKSSTHAMTAESRYFYGLAGLLCHTKEEVDELNRTILRYDMDCQHRVFHSYHELSFTVIMQCLWPSNRVSGKVIVSYNTTEFPKTVRYCVKCKKNASIEQLQFFVSLGLLFLNCWTISPHSLSHSGDLKSITVFLFFLIIFTFTTAYFSGNRVALDHLVSGRGHYLSHSGRIIIILFPELDCATGNIFWSFFPRTESTLEKQVFWYISVISVAFTNVCILCH